MLQFAPHDRALLNGSFEEVEVLAQDGENVLIKRAGGQTTVHANQLEPYDDTCPLP